MKTASIVAFMVTLLCSCSEHPKPVARHVPAPEPKPFVVVMPMPYWPTQPIAPPVFHHDPSPLEPTTRAFSSNPYQDWSTYYPPTPVYQPQPIVYPESRFWYGGYGFDARNTFWMLEGN